VGALLAAADFLRMEDAVNVCCNWLLQVAQHSKGSPQVSKAVRAHASDPIGATYAGDDPRRTRLFRAYKCRVTTTTRPTDPMPPPPSQPWQHMCPESVFMVRELAVEFRQGTLLDSVNRYLIENFEQASIGLGRGLGVGRTEMMMRKRVVLVSITSSEID
jgi:hypothetical protein